MLNKESFKKLIGLGLDFGHYCLLQYLDTSVPIEDLLTIDKVRGHTNLLVKRGLILVQGVQYCLTVKGKELLQEVEGGDEQESVKGIDEMSINLIYRTVQDKLFNLTGKKQVQSMVRGKGYPFMCNSVDFTKKMEEVIRKYKPSSMVKLKDCLLTFIERCYTNNQWSPLLKYYILKEDRGSDLMNDYELYEEPEEEKPKELIRTKDLF